MMSNPNSQSIIHFQLIDERTLENVVVYPEQSALHPYPLYHHTYGLFLHVREEKQGFVACLTRLNEPLRTTGLYPHHWNSSSIYVPMTDIFEKKVRLVYPSAQMAASVQIAINESLAVWLFHNQKSLFTRKPQLVFRGGETKSVTTNTSMSVVTDSPKEKIIVIPSSPKEDPKQTVSRSSSDSYFEGTLVTLLIIPALIAFLLGIPFFSKLLVLLLK